MSRFTRWSLATGTGLIAVAGIAAASSSAAGKSKGKADSGTAYLAVTPKPGSLQYAAGFDSDKVLGQVAVTYAIKVTNATSGTFHLTVNSVQFWTSTGELSGTATATLTLAAGGAATITNGKLNLTKGSGAQKGHSMAATFTGTGDANKGQYTFTYKGKYK
jgi:hypothetical protein